MRAEGFSYWETLGKMENPYRADEKVKLTCLICRSLPSQLTSPAADNITHKDRLALKKKSRALRLTMCSLLSLSLCVLYQSPGCTTWGAVSGGHKFITRCMI